jgi:dihydrophenazinedicarboxylate synthase
MSLLGSSRLIETNWESAPANPMSLMKNWITQAEEVNVSEALGMTLCTVDDGGWPWNRVVLLKELGESSLIFCSSSVSSKGKDMDKNPRVSGSLWWRESIQQIHFQGFAFVATEEKSSYFFEKRSRSAQAVALLSKQSQPLESELDLKTKVEILCDSEKPLARPPTWNAYEIIPIRYEFWQGDASRMHKRLQYSLEVPNIDLKQVNSFDSSMFGLGKWVQKRLQP